MADVGGTSGGVFQEVQLFSYVECGYKVCFTVL